MLAIQVRDACPELAYGLAVRSLADIRESQCAAIHSVADMSQIRDVLAQTTTTVV